MATRREKGLCYNYDERCGPNHWCRDKFFLLVAPPDEPLPDEPIPPDPVIPMLLELPSKDPSASHSTKLSLHAMARHSVSSTLRVTSSVQGHKVIILVDGGSTHNFIQDRVAYFLHLTPQPTKQLCVMVGNGTELCCNQVCKAISIIIQGHQFVVDLYVIALGGADIIFGVEWLKTLGPITTDYSVLTMFFSWQNEPVGLSSQKGPGLVEATHAQI